MRLALQVGTQLLFSPVRHPQSNGTVERFHQDYQLHVWQDPYLADLKAVQHQAAQFFDQYRHSEHHTVLKGETPAMRHQRTTVSRLPENFSVPTGKLPLYPGQVHFMRRVQPNGTVSVLKVDWTVPEPDPRHGVWVTLDLTPDQAALSLYDAAPDVPDRTCLVTYPFPLKEPVRSHPSAASAQQPLSKPIAEPPPDLPNCPSEISETPFVLWRWLPDHLPDPISRPPRRLIRATLIHTANFVRNVAETMF
ncbi:MAG: integrase core domain-containing protein [Anaerolineae bacterium]|nr:integrase core domain-containing protein [Anaerolineae bacterium]